MDPRTLAAQCPGLAVSPLCQHPREGCCVAWDPGRESPWGQRHLNQTKRARNDRDRVRVHGGLNTLRATVQAEGGLITRLTDVCHLGKKRPLRPDCLTYPFLNEILRPKILATNFKKPIKSEIMLPVASQGHLAAVIQSTGGRRKTGAL